MFGSCNAPENKIKAGSVKLKHFAEKTLQHCHNTLFKTNQSQVYKELSGVTRSDNPSPDAKEARAFWSGIWSNQHLHNSEAEWLKDVKEELDGKVG